MYLKKIHSDILKQKIKKIILNQQINAKDSKRYYANTKKKEKFTIFIDKEPDMTPRRHLVFGPSYPKDLKIIWSSSGTESVVKGVPICIVQDNDGLESHLYSPATGKITQRIARNYEVITNKHICTIEEEYVFFKKKSHRVSFHSQIFKSLGTVRIFKGTGFVIAEGDEIAEFTNSIGQKYILTIPFPGVITAMYAKHGGFMASDQTVCVIRELTDAMASLILERQKEYRKIYGKETNPTLQYLAAKKFVYLPSKYDADFYPYSSIFFSVDMRECLKLASLAGLNHNLQPKKVLTCLYVMAASKVLQKHRNFARPYYTPRWTANENIDITIALIDPEGEAFPTIRGVNRLTLKKLYEQLEYYRVLHMHRKLRNSWADDYTFLISDVSPFGMGIFVPGIMMSSLATLSFSGISPVIAYVKGEDGTTKLCSFPKVLITLTYDTRLMKYDGEPLIFMNEFKKIVENPILLI